MSLIIREDFSMIDEDIEQDILELDTMFESLMLEVNDLYFDDLTEDFVVEAMTNTQKSANLETIISNIERIVDSSLTKINKEKEEYDLTPPQENAMRALISVVVNPNVEVPKKLQTKILTLRSKCKAYVNVGNIDIIDTLDWINRISRNLSWVDKETINEDYIIENPLMNTVSSLNNKFEDEYEKTMKFAGGTLDNDMLDKIADGGMMSGALGSIGGLFTAKPEQMALGILNSIIDGDIDISEVSVRLKELMDKHPDNVANGGNLFKFLDIEAEELYEIKQYEATDLAKSSLSKADDNTIMAVAVWFLGNGSLTRRISKLKIALRLIQFFKDQHD